MNGDRKVGFPFFLILINHTFFILPLNSCCLAADSFEIYFQLINEFIYYKQKGRQQLPVEGKDREMKGRAGEKGYGGDVGQRGETGEPGVLVERQGDSGVKGEKGNQGLSGDLGEQGPMGLIGMGGNKGQ